MMPGDELTLVLSGHLCRPQSADLRPFWRGFVELQHKLPASKKLGQIVVHSWNPELADLASSVYGPQAECHEAQPCFYPEFMQRINPPDRFEIGLNRLNSTWKNVSLQSVLGNARSRAKAVQLMDKLPERGAQVLVTRWDLGQTGSTQVNQLIADPALPESYLYLSYFSEVDEGYADMWLLAPWATARRFGDFDTFVIDSLAGDNAYLEEFIESGWPRARKKTLYESVVSHPVGQRAHGFASRWTKAINSRVLGSTLPERLLRRLVGPIQRLLDQPPLTAENSCLTMREVAPPTFPSYMALNIHALLKYFILSEGLRERTRFLTREDFDLAKQSGQLINPTPIVLIVHDADDAAMACLLTESPLPLVCIYQLYAGKVCQHLPNEQGGWDITVLRAPGMAPRDLLACALDAEQRREIGAPPVLIMPTVERYLGCTDWFYMNALAKYLAYSRAGYVGLASSRRGRLHLDFPDLQLVKGGGAFSLRIAAGTAKGMRAFVDVADPDLDELSDRADRMLLEFLVVVKAGGLF